jgi:hypothetical protein
MIELGERGRALGEKKGVETSWRISGKFFCVMMSLNVPVTIGGYDTRLFH